MANLVISGDTSGSVTLAAPAVSGTTVLTLPTTTGTLVVTGGAQTIEFADGTVSAPSITNSGDTNTGIYFPAADTIAFTEGGVESMRIDSSGNVGIGLSNGAAKLTVAGTNANGTGAAATFIGSIQINEAGSFSLQTTGGLEFKASVFGAGYGAKIFGADDGALLFGNRANSATWSERMRIDQSGNVGIGTSSPLGRLALGSLVSNQVLSMYDDGTNWYGFGISSANFQISAATGAAITFNNITRAGGGTNTERMRIDSSGNLLVGTTSFNASPDCFIASGGSTYIGHLNGTASGAVYSYFYYNNTPIGSITQNGTTAVLYNTTSDYRLKTDVTPIQNALTTIKALNPVSFTWVDGRLDEGFLAHEIQAVIPNCVTGEKDAVNKDGTPKYQQMDNSGVIPFLVKAIQELNAKVTALEKQLGAK